jgi:beta-lactam-binding protein with PASTA domain
LRQAQARESTMPRVDGRDSSGGEIVYAGATNKAILMPDLRGLSVRDVVRACAQLGMQLEAHGEGRVVKQTPESGAELRSGQIIYVDFGRLN